MNKLLKNNSFKLGFIIGILFFIAANFYTILPKSKVICFDCYNTFGFPFNMHEEGTILHLNQFIWSGVVANFAVGLVFSFVLGIIFKLIWSKFTAQKLK